MNTTKIYIFMFKANSVQKRRYNCVNKQTKTFWENYAPDTIAQGSQARPDFCGWTAIVPVTLYHEFIQNKK